jgi:hypothetical protein
VISLSRSLSLSLSLSLSPPLSRSPGSHYVAQASLKLAVLLSLPPKCWDYTSSHSDLSKMPSCPAIPLFKPLPWLPTVLGLKFQLLSPGLRALLEEGNLPCVRCCPLCQSAFPDCNKEERETVAQVRKLLSIMDWLYCFRPGPSQHIVVGACGTVKLLTPLPGSKRENEEGAEVLPSSLRSCPQ